MLRESMVLVNFIGLQWKPLIVPHVNLFCQKSEYQKGNYSVKCDLEDTKCAIKICLFSLFMRQKNYRITVLYIYIM